MKQQQNTSTRHVRGLLALALAAVTLSLHQDLHAQGAAVKRVRGAVATSEIETNITTRIKKDGTTTSVTNTTKTTVDAPLSLENNYVQLNSGIMLLNPYEVKQAGGKTYLTNQSTEARFFIDIAVNYIWAWNYDRRYEWVLKQQRDASKKGGFASLFQGTLADTDAHGWEVGLGAPDFQGHLTYIAKDKNETTASAIVGTGEFGMELTIGLPFYQAIYTKSHQFKAGSAKELFDETISTHWVGLVGSWSGTTDGRAFDIHSRYFAGVGYRAAFKTPWDVDGADVQREVVLSFQAGIARVDGVRFKGSSDTEIVAGRRGDLPEYSKQTSFGVEAEMYVPINKALNAVLGARFYSGDDKQRPDTWTAYTALTIPLSKLNDLLQ